MANRELMDELKNLIIDKLNLEDMKIDDIGDEEILFGEGLGLDSVDALELSLAISQKYNILINAKTDNVKSIFKNVLSLSEFIENNRK